MNSNDKKDKTLRFSFLDGIFASGMTGFTQDYFTPFILHLGATVKQVGFLSALPNLFGALMQLKSADVTDKLKSRKRVITLFVFLQAVMLLPMVALSLLGEAKVAIFIAIVTLFISLGAFVLPAWGSMMSDIIPETKRGEYFGWRNRVLGLVAVVSSFTAGFVLYLTNKTNVLLGFAAIFGLAFIFRMFSWYFLKRMREPGLEHKEEDYFSLVDFLSRIRESNFAQFTLFVSLMHFSTYIASPFFAVLMLRDLHFSYLLYIVIILSATVTVYLTIGRWGIHADKVGNIKILRFTAPLVAIVPLFWIVDRHPLFLCFAQVFSGFAWAGFNLSASNFIYDSSSPGKRTRCISYFNVLSGIFISAGAILGGFLAPKLPHIFGYNLLTLFLVSSILRLIAAFLIRLKIKEVRPVENVSSNQLFFSMIGIRPIFSDIQRKTPWY
ncbi:MAG: MFS transporter [candidate division Zixibacteria bacterium]|nr:MFS transporter [candidate division Zixibacteria bacterium]